MSKRSIYRAAFQRMSSPSPPPTQPPPPPTKVGMFQVLRKVPNFLLNVFNAMALVIVAAELTRLKEPTFFDSFCVAVGSIVRWVAS